MNPTLLPATEIRAVEALAGGMGEPLMVRAGRAAAQFAARLAGETGQAILVVAGPGHNGGDAWVTARNLQQSFHRVTVLDAVGGETPLADPVARDAKAAFTGTVVHEFPDTPFALIVDGLFGIGLSRDIGGDFAAIINRINASPIPVLSIDLPSGIDGDTGCIRGCAVKADHTLTFIALKPGLFTADGPDHAGNIALDNLGLDVELEGIMGGTLLKQETVAGWLAPRRKNTHKGSFGGVAVIGGADGMVGAALLASRAALYLGAGKSFCGLLASDSRSVDPVAPEIMLRPVEHLLDLPDVTVVVVGPGMGHSQRARAALHGALMHRMPVVIDADGLNLLASDEELRALLARRESPTVLTPHPGEAARLLGVRTDAVQRNRIAATVKLAKMLKCEVVLKGAGSVIVSPDGSWAVNATGNPGMASAGMGDTLSGMIGALLAQGMEAGRAARFGVCLHGAAADRLAEEGEGPLGLRAGEVGVSARRVLNAWMR
jgi:ADP-dependent NAD(P)H-hydrate dehydratase / NAD(P)H-hydrate epimerase